MNETKKSRVPLIILNFIAAAFGVAANVYVLLSKEASVFTKIGAAVVILALGASLLYLFNGYKKNAAGYFKLYMCLFAMAQLVSTFATVYSAPNGQSLISVAFPALTYGPILVLALVENLGKKRSYLVCAFVVAAYLTASVLILVMVPGLLAGGTEAGTLCLIRSGTTLLLAIIMSMMIVAKYRDKEERGTN